MSSTSTMSSSLERPMTICLSVFRGNSPPWYLPEMNRRAQAVSVLDAAIVVRSPYSSLPAKTKLPASPEETRRRRPVLGSGTLDEEVRTASSVTSTSPRSERRYQARGSHRCPGRRSTESIPRICQRSLPVRREDEHAQAPGGAPREQPRPLPEGRERAGQSRRQRPLRLPAPTVSPEPHPLPAERSRHRN